MVNTTSMVLTSAGTIVMIIPMIPLADTGPVRLDVPGIHTSLRKPSARDSISQQVLRMSDDNLAPLNSYEIRRMVNK